jgi:hypothetical protein
MGCDKNIQHIHKHFLECESTPMLKGSLFQSVKSSGMPTTFNHITQAVQPQVTFITDDHSAQHKYVKLCDIRFSEVNIKITIWNLLPCSLVDKF